MNVTTTSSFKIVFANSKSLGLDVVKFFLDRSLLKGNVEYQIESIYNDVGLWERCHLALFSGLQNMDVWDICPHQHPQFHFPSFRPVLIVLRSHRSFIVSTRPMLCVYLCRLRETTSRGGIAATALSELSVLAFIKELVTRHHVQTNPRHTSAVKLVWSALNAVPIIVCQILVTLGVFITVD